VDFENYTVRDFRLAQGETRGFWDDMGVEKELIVNGSLGFLEDFHFAPRSLETGLSGVD